MKQPGNRQAQERAEELYAEWLGRRTEGSGTSFEDLLGEAGTLKNLLIPIHEQHQRMSAVLQERKGMGRMLATDSLLQRRGDLCKLTPTERDRLGALYPGLLDGLEKRAQRFGRYRVDDEAESRLGEGGMGVVYRAWDTELDRPVAVKFAKRGLVRFLGEARVAARLDHPGIVPIHELGLDPQGRPYYVMSVVEGDSLRDVLDNPESHGSQRALRITVLGVLLRVCETLAHAHERKVVHRDLKPDNIMLGKHGEVYVVDWGLAVLDGEDGTVAEEEKGARGSRLTLADAVLGTVHYMPPERADRGRGPTDPASDVYALGAILYESLTGRPPYADLVSRKADDPDYPRVVLALLKARPPTPLRRLAPGLPRELVTIVETAMARDVTRRYVSIEQLRLDLTAYLEGGVLRRDRSRWVLVSWKWVRRNRALFAAVVLGLVTLNFGRLWWKAEGALQRKELRALAAESAERLREAEKARQEFLTKLALLPTQDLLHPRPEEAADDATMLIDFLIEHGVRFGDEDSPVPRSMASLSDERLEHRILDEAVHLAGFLADSGGEFQGPALLLPEHAAHLTGLWEEVARTVDRHETRPFRRHAWEALSVFWRTGELVADELETGLPLAFRLAVEPESAGDWEAFGDLLRRSGQLEGARECYARALTLDPHRYYAHLRLATLVQEPEQKLEHFASCARVRPGRYATYYNLLVNAVQAPKELTLAAYASAHLEDLYEKGQLPPRIASYWQTQRAVAEGGVEGLEMLRTQVDGGDATVETYIQLAYSTLTSGQVAEDLSRVEEGVATHTRNGRLRYNLGRMYDELMRVEEALEAYETSITLGVPDPWLARTNAGICAQSLYYESQDKGLRRRAREHLEQAAELKPGNSTSQLNLALILFAYEPGEDGEPWFRAIGCLRRARQLGQPDQARVYATQVAAMLEPETGEIADQLRAALAAELGD